MRSRFSGFVPLLVVTMTFAGCGDDLTTEATTPQQGPTSPQGPQATPPNVAPIAVAGPDQTAECGSFNGSSISLTSTGSSDSDGQITLYEWFENGQLIATGPAPTLTLPLGTHTIILRTTDNNGGTNDDVVVVTVRDTSPPSVVISMARTSLWPPNHKMHVVSRVTASDVCDPAPAIAITVTSDEPVNGLGDGNTEPDWTVAQTGASMFDVSVRAERSGLGDGRVYSISAVATDGAGNASTPASGTVTVPHNQ